jgi:hypothetical protein
MDSLVDSTTVTVLALGLAAFALGLAALLVVRLGRLERAVRSLDGGAGPAARLAPSGPRGDVEALRRELAQVRADLSTALRHVAVVRYDAFEDLAGRLSFSAALLDDAGDGVVVTSINGRGETRTYAKGVTSGSSGHPLSPEEKEAIARARAADPVPQALAG